jgi:hypothetical protein
MGSSTPLETFERLWRIANEIAAIRETEVKIAAFTDLSCKRAGLLPEMLTRHGLELRRQLTEKRQKLGKKMGKAGGLLYKHDVIIRFQQLPRFS